jgi:hypothetical protein
MYVASLSDGSERIKASPRGIVVLVSPFRRNTITFDATELSFYDWEDHFKRSTTATVDCKGLTDAPLRTRVPVPPPSSDRQRLDKRQTFADLHVLYTVPRITMIFALQVPMQVDCARARLAE